MRFRNQMIIYNVYVQLPGDRLRAPCIKIAVSNQPHQRVLCYGKCHAYSHKARDTEYT